MRDVLIGHLEIWAVVILLARAHEKNKVYTLSKNTIDSISKEEKHEVSLFILKLKVDDTDTEAIYQTMFLRGNFYLVFFLLIKLFICSYHKRVINTK